MNAHIEMVPISGSAVEGRCDTIHVSMKMRERNSSFFIKRNTPAGVPLLYRRRECSREIVHFLREISRYIEKGQKGQKG